LNILLTGATGFVGSSVLKGLIDKNHTVTAAVKSSQYIRPDIEHFAVESIGSDTPWGAALSNCELVIHCAARVHVISEIAADPLAEFKDINTFGTLNLARQAAKAGVKRFIFISTIKVNGEYTSEGTPFKANDVVNPTDYYAISKFEAEMGLLEIADETNMDVVIIRPPLVYGAGVKANFKQMIKWTANGIPLPLGGIHNNKRSLVSLDNLVDLIYLCINHPKAANQIFLVSDDNDLSTSQLLLDIAIALGVRSRLIPIPVPWLVFFANLIGKPGITNRLCGSLQVDITKTKKLLNWKPKLSAAVCLKNTTDSFLKNR